MSYHIFLDDERNLSDVTWIQLPSKIRYNWKTVRNFQQFTICIASYGLPEFISFDHDLADQHYGHGLRGDEIPYNQYSEKTGYDCAKWLVDYCIDNNLKFPKYAIHSMNPVGAKNIKSYIENARRNTSI